MTSLTVKLGGNLDVVDPARRRWNRSAILTHPFKVKLNDLANGALSFLNGCARGHAAGQIRNVRRAVPSGVLDNDGVVHGQLPYFFRPDCFRILLSVPAAKSSLGFPAMVTRPGLLGLELAVTSASRNEVPAIGVQHSQDVTDLHA